MSNFMNPSSAFITLIVAFGLFTGGSAFMGSVFDKHNVEKSQDVSIDKEYDDLQGKTRAVDEKLETVTSDQGNLLETASAGILIVPDTLNLLLEPVSIATSTIGEISNAFPTLIPDWLSTMLTLIIIAAVGFGVLRILIGVTTI